MRRENEFRPRVGRIRDQSPGQVQSYPSHIAEVLSAGRRAGLGVFDPGPRKGTGSAGRGRAVLRSGRAAARQVVVKSYIVRHQGARYRAAPLKMHLSYLRRAGVARDGESPKMFGPDGDVDHGAFATRCEDDRHHFRFVVSPEDAGELADLRATTRDLMRTMEKDLGTRLDWAAIDHWNTDNPHVHVLVRGVAQDGSDLVIDKDYLFGGLRDRARQLVSLELGPRSQREIEASLDREVHAERVTSLDRQLKGRASAADGVVDLRPDGRSQTAPTRRLIGRVQQLERYGLAQRQGEGRWRLADDLETRLKVLAERGDIIKTLHKTMKPDRDPGAIAVDAERLGEPILGRLMDRGLHDELNGAAYVIIDGVDGRLHHVRLRDLSETGDTPRGGIVEVRMREVEGHRPRIQLVHRADLSIEAQVSADGATWLDRQLVAREPQALSPAGFGGEVQEALAQRLVHLEGEGLARRRGGRLEPANNLIGSLKSRELGRVAEQLKAQTGSDFLPTAEGDAVGGLYQRRLDLASGRFAMIDDGLGFQLVPWTRALDARLGLTVEGTLNRTGGVDWTLGRKRGLGV
ncbi:type VI secretion protein [Caulobacter flavus]|uniref:Type VI secretion protein n=1 Tax=Caulobacter flavus TaxID=1679497 RepID=A0A2N5CP02_9CAUL|nr:DUF3363 domain-containing protein [Caulobacter flavus]AYV48604.1 type VI secretion protein [Caulobacter flavus]PLR08680.1 type VI secretion protein [Caulobacter flavus]